MNEEVVLLEEQLAVAHADIERLQNRLAEVEAKAAGREADAEGLRRQLDAAGRELADRDGILESRAGELAALQARIEEAGARSQADAGRYLTLALAHEPDLPADLVSGDSIVAVEQSLQQARQTVAQVRQHIEEQARIRRVPTGAPVRAAPDTSELSPSEKIRLGLQRVE